MKRCLVLLCLILPLIGRSQPFNKQQDLLGKGHLNVGISIGQGYKGSYATTSTFIPRIHYFLADGWSVGLEGRYLTANSPTYNSYYPFTYLGAGLSTRYYVLRSNRLAVFAQLGVAYGQSTYDKYEPTDPFASMNGIRNNNWQTNACIGVHYRLAKRWSVEATAERSWLPSSYLTPAYNRWQASIGINYQLK